MKVAKRRGGYRDEEEKEEKEEKIKKGVNLVSLSGAKRGVEVLTTDETEANKVHLKLIRLKQVYEDTYFEMAHLLWRVSNERLYTAKSLGAHDHFKDYVESELGFTVRKAHMLSAIHWWFNVEQKGDARLIEEAKSIGWTKAYHLVRVVDPQNADKWFELARSISEKELGQHARAGLKAAGKKKDRRDDSALKMNPPPGMTPDDPEPVEFPFISSGSGKSNGKGAIAGGEELEGESLGVAPPTEDQVKEVKEADKEWTTFSMRIPKDTKDSILEAVEVAKGLANTRNDGYSLSLIAQHFLSFTHDKKTVMIGEWLAAFERNTGLMVIALDPKDEKVIYGREYLNTEGEDEGVK